jgi:hypothetical protein
MSYNKKIEDKHARRGRGLVLVATISRRRHVLALLKVAIN